MAKVYSVAEAVKVLADGSDLDAIYDIGKRYPLFALKVQKVISKAGDDFVELANFFPEFVTANKINKQIKSLLSDDETEDEKREKVKTEKTGRRGRPRKIVEPEIEEDTTEENEDDTEEVIEKPKKSKTSKKEPEPEPEDDEDEDEWDL